MSPELPPQCPGPGPGLPKKLRFGASQRGRVAAPAADAGHALLDENTPPFPGAHRATPGPAAKQQEGSFVREIVQLPEKPRRAAVRLSEFSASSHLLRSRQQDATFGWHWCLALTEGQRVSGELESPAPCWAREGGGDHACSPGQRWRHWQQPLLAVPNEGEVSSTTTHAPGSAFLRPTPVPMPWWKNLWRPGPRREFTGPPPDTASPLPPLHSPLPAPPSCYMGGSAQGSIAV
ncbi:uncharacterized protein LOC104867526 [Fukomys damarensis]|uniref:uncharacterized protein LOC104867526 n=1 Tax=Fukomys damarensis TaxID=885580 RepID=UPI00053F6487|nr:uncharacterized protein LOC104867526 [Fukomys damarensis]